jgi:hypothetical protein
MPSAAAWRFMDLFRQLFPHYEEPPFETRFDATWPHPDEPRYVASGIGGGR